MSLSSFRHRRALIVGGTSGIGRATAIALARLGASVVVIGLDSNDFSELMEESPNDSRIGQPEIRTIVADVISSEQWSRAFNSAVSMLEGRVDIFVSTVGGSARSAGDSSLTDCTAPGWNQAILLNLTTSFQLLQSIVTQMLIQPQDEFGQRGMIALTGSVLANRPEIDHFNTIGYAAAKAGLEGLVINSAAAYASEGIRINLLKPGLVQTPMAARALQNDQIMQTVRHRQPLTHGPVSAEACAQAILGLVNPLAVGLTGSLLAMDGGWSIH